MEEPRKEIEKMKAEVEQLNADNSAMRNKIGNLEAELKKAPLGD
jgi:hypothetical protein